MSRQQLITFNDRDRAVIRKLWPTDVSAVDIAKRLGFETSSINAEAKRLGLLPRNMPSGNSSSRLRNDPRPPPTVTLAKMSWDKIP